MRKRWQMDDGTPLTIRVLLALVVLIALGALAWLEITRGPMWWK